MDYSFSIVKKMIIKSWITLTGSTEALYQGWTVKNAIEVFNEFSEEYEAYFHRSPPRMTQPTVDWIVESLPSDGVMDFDPMFYEAMIPAYLRTKFDSSCNYGMAHFMSGEVRRNRYYEELL